MRQGCPQFGENELCLISVALGVGKILQLVVEQTVALGAAGRRYLFLNAPTRNQCVRKIKIKTSVSHV